MASPKAKPLVTVDQYLALERAAETRSEYLDGVLYAMAGESGEHGDISVNIVASFVTQLKGKRCRARSKDTKVRSGSTPLSGRSTSGLFSYPDVVVICGEPEYHDTVRDIVLNPAAIAEVLSPSTEDFDRGTKRERYLMWNPTLRYYLLIAQDRPHVLVYSRPDADSAWTQQEYSGLETSVPLPGIGCVLALADVYDRVFRADQHPNSAAAEA